MVAFNGKLARWFRDRADGVMRPGASGTKFWEGEGASAVEVEAVELERYLAWRWAEEADVAPETTVMTLVEWWLTPRPEGGTTLRVRRAPKRSRRGLARRNSSNSPRSSAASQKENRVTPLFDRLIPILGDLEGERDFYVWLGFEITYQGSEFPDFVAMGYGPIEFGLEHKDGFSRDDPGRVLTWQFGVTDLEPAKEQLTAAGVDDDEGSVTPSADWRYRVLRARTPNGSDLLLEGGRE